MLLYKHNGIGFVYNLERTLFAQVHLPDNRLLGGGLMAARCNASIQISTDWIVKGAEKGRNQQPEAWNNEHACVPAESRWLLTLK